MDSGTLFTQQSSLCDLAPCRLCEAAHGHPMPRMMVVSPSRLLHVVDDNGVTLCGHQADEKWTWKDTQSAR